MSTTLQATSPPSTQTRHHDVVVIGAGFGGMGAALRLAELGADVALCESLRYPGGCASTFSRGGVRFEAGATLFGGFAPGQLFHTWIERHGMEVPIDWLDPIVELRAPGLSLDIPSRRDALVEAMAALPGARREALTAFFEHQRQVADALWALFADPTLLPPFGPGQLLTHLRHSPRYLPLLGLVGRPLEAVVRRFGLEDFEPLRIYLDAVCQITVQTSAAQAEAPFALAATDYFFRGTGHVRGGVGTLAWEMTRAIERAGGTVSMANRVRSLRRTPEGWRVETRQGTILARAVVANLLPHDLRALLELEPGHNRTLDQLAGRVEGGWGAVMLYLTAQPPPEAGPDPHHIEIIQDPSAPFTEGNHLFASISGANDGPRAPDGQRTLTVSTHIRLAELAALSPERQAARIDLIHDRMRQGLRRHAPAWAQRVTSEMTASPRTFARFTRRHLGYVGGIPRTAGLHNYRQLTPIEPLEGLTMVGDTAFPGQSTLATAIGGLKVAEAVAATLR